MVVKPSKNISQACRATCSLFVIFAWQILGSITFRAWATQPAARGFRDCFTASPNLVEVALMKTILTSLLFAVTATVTIAATTAHAAPSPASLLRAADCIQTDRINDWHIVDARTAIVRTGPKSYLVTLKSACPKLSHPPGLIFSHSNNQGIDQGRICGSVGETVHSRGQPPCAIESVQLIDKSRYQQLSDQAARYRKHGAMPEK
jgi:hypothetical protein